MTTLCPTLPGQIAARLAPLPTAAGITQPRQAGADPLAFTLGAAHREHGLLDRA